MVIGEAVRALQKSIGQVRWCGSIRWRRAIRWESAVPCRQWSISMKQKTFGFTWLGITCNALVTKLLQVNTLVALSPIGLVKLLCLSSRIFQQTHLDNSDHKFSLSTRKSRNSPHFGYSVTVRKSRWSKIAFVDDFLPDVGANRVSTPVPEYCVPTKQSKQHLYPGPQDQLQGYQLHIKSFPIKWTIFHSVTSHSLEKETRNILIYSLSPTTGNEDTNQKHAFVH